jgi:hypothetical protein
VGIKDGSSDMIKFNPEDIQDEEYQSLEYYCKYHPDRMRRKILFTKNLVFLLILLLLKMGIRQMNKILSLTFIKINLSLETLKKEN